MEICLLLVTAGIQKSELWCFNFCYLKVSDGEQVVHRSRLHVSVNLSLNILYVQLKVYLHGTLSKYQRMESHHLK